jgi:aspartate kinase
MELKVAKFGGTSMATAESINKCADIILSDKSRRYVVVSAPGKRFKDDIKVTDLLYKCFYDLEFKGECKDNFQKIRDRFTSIVSDLKLNFDINPYLDKVEKEMLQFHSAEYCASRGEYLSAIVMAQRLGFDFIDAKDIMVFSPDGVFMPEETNEKVASILKNYNKAVIPGFYGADEFGTIHTFSRGGSDVSGAVIARAKKATLYENWTDVNGFLVVDPRIVEAPKGIEVLSYKELRELSYMGANVLHPDSIFPVRACGIPINIKNTFEPNNKGTLIVPKIPANADKRVVTGIAGKKGYSIIFIEKSMMNNEIAFMRKVLTALEYYNISVEHIPSGIDTMSVVIADSEIAGKEDVVIEKIRNAVNPDHIEIKKGIALIATVGHGMSFTPGTSAKLCTALAQANVNIRMLDQGSSELNIIVGVSEQDYNKAINAIYHAFY